MENITAWKCSTTDASTTTCVVTATSTAATSTYQGVPYGDWILVNTFILILLAFIPVSMLFSIFTKKYR